MAQKLSAFVLGRIFRGVARSVSTFRLSGDSNGENLQPERHIRNTHAPTDHHTLCCTREASLRIRCRRRRLVHGPPHPHPRTSQFGDVARPSAPNEEEEPRQPTNQLRMVPNNVVINRHITIYAISNELNSMYT